MLSAVLSLSLLAQGEPLPKTPEIPPITNRSFHEAVLSVEEAMSKEDWALAKTRMKALPRLNATITWDDAAVPADLRVAYAEARDNVVKYWQGVGLKTEFKFAPKGDLVIKFDKQLPDGDLGIPAGAGHLFSFEPAEPRLTAVIGLNRGKPANRALPSEIANEFSHALAAYFGLERSLIANGARFRTDLPSNGFMRPNSGDVFLVNRLQKVVDTLDKGIAKKVKFEAKKPKLFIEMSKVTLEPVLQGEQQSFSMTITNNGEAPLTLWVEPDCACLAPNSPSVIQPGQTGLIKVGVNSVDFLGKLRKWLFVYSNDLDFPLREIPVDVDIRPLFRFIKEGPPIIQMTDEGATASFLFWTENPDKVKPDQSRLSGLEGEITVEPWEGELADPEMGEEKKLRKGLRYSVKMKPKIIFGRVGVMLAVSTNHPIFSIIRANLQVQRGIIAMPERVYLGEIPRAATLATFILSRPETNFKIKKISTDSPFVKVKAQASRGEWEYRVDIEIDGKMEFGFFNANVIIETDDPSQREIIVPIEATVR